MISEQYNNFQNSSTPFYLTETDISSYKAQNSFKSKKKNDQATTEQTTTKKQTKDKTKKDK